MKYFLPDLSASYVNYNLVIADLITGRWVMYIVIYTVGHKKRATLLMSITSPIIEIFKIVLLAYSADNLQ